jgi:Predicted membrane protein
MIQDSWFMIMPMEFTKFNMVTVLTVFLMAGVACLTRLLGCMVLQNRVSGPRVRSVMEAASGCVLVSGVAVAAILRQIL